MKSRLARKWNPNNENYEDNGVIDGLRTHTTKAMIYDMI